MIEKLSAPHEPTLRDEERALHAEFPAWDVWHSAGMGTRFYASIARAHDVAETVDAASIPLLRIEIALAVRARKRFESGREAAARRAA